MPTFTSRVRRDPDGYQWIYMPLRVKDHKQTKEEATVLVGRNLFERQHGPSFNLEEMLDEYTYDPFVVEPALFRIFAGLEPSEDRILEFARQYGDIASPAFIQLFCGCSLTQWQSAIKLVQEATEKADAYAAVVQRRAPQAGEAEGIANVVNNLLKSAMIDSVMIVDEGRPAMRLLIRNLFDVMKLQVAQAVAENKRYRTCPQCAKPFEVTPKVNRSDRQFCSDKCRVNAYLARKRQAIALREQGQKLQAIARTVGTDLRTVKGWVAGVDSEE